MLLCIIMLTVLTRKMLRAVIEKRDSWVAMVLKIPRKKHSVEESQTYLSLQYESPKCRSAYAVCYENEIYSHQKISQTDEENKALVHETSECFNFSDVACRIDDIEPIKKSG